MAGVKGRSGGQRSGAGRKAATARVLDILDGRDRASARPVEQPLEPIACPVGADAATAAVWQELAPLAKKAGTLVATTGPAFLRLCRAVVKHARMEAAIDADGLTFVKVTVDGSGQKHTELKAHPLISRAETVDNKIRGWFKDFGINPFGKPLADVTPKPANPLSRFLKHG